MEWEEEAWLFDSGHSLRLEPRLKLQSLSRLLLLTRLGRAVLEKQAAWVTLMELEVEYLQRLSPQRRRLVTEPWSLRRVWEEQEERTPWWTLSRAQ